MEQGTVTSLYEENGVVRGVRYRTKDDEEHQAYAPLTVVCDGCFSNLRRSLCKAKVKFCISSGLNFIDFEFEFFIFF